MCSLGPIRKSKPLDYALSEAESFIPLTNQERLSKLEYTENTVNVDSQKQTVSSVASTANNKQSQPQVRRDTTSDAGARKKPTSSRNTQGKKVLADKSNLAVVMKQEHPSKEPKPLETSILCESVHEDLFKTLGMGFSDENRINLVATNIVKQIQSQLMAALNVSQSTTLTLSTKENTTGRK